MKALSLKAISDNADNQLSGAGYAYDGNGSPTTYLGQSLKYDPEERLTGYGTAEANTYTGDGLRAHKGFSGGGSVYYVYDGDEPVAEVDGGGGAHVRGQRAGVPSVRGDDLLHVRPAGQHGAGARRLAGRDGLSPARRVRQLGLVGAGRR